jgi:putative ABC transport system permease protein
MRLSTLLYLYSRRLRVHALQELLAALGLAGAVALVFAVTVANSSIAGSAGEVVKTLAGPGSLELVTRSPEGFSEGLLKRVEGLPAVSQAAPLLEETATIDGPAGHRVTVNLLGADVSLAILDGLAHTLPRSALSSGAITVTGATAKALGITQADVQAHGGEPISLKLWGQSHSLRVSAVLGADEIGALAQARGAITSLEYLQQLTGLGDRITRVLVEPLPGRQAAVRSELQGIADGRITVTSTDEELARLAQALAPSGQATLLFGVVAGLLGLLLAVNAVLLTVPERRRVIAELRHPPFPVFTQRPPS